MGAGTPASALFTQTLVIHLRVTMTLRSGLSMAWWYFHNVHHVISTLQFREDHL